ncbi:MAG: sigma-70 family RNA polymerase sigma factor [Eubacteriales bacterium]|nr:sigma-70 family RNA polymerase sigma factor [Eubacteriales bacterium]
MDLEERYDKLLRYCYMKLRDETLAEDITQETFTRFYESKNYHDTGKEMAYLYTIARNLCTDHFRKHQDVLIGDLPSEEQDTPTAGNQEAMIVNRLSIESALDRLDAEERELLMLRFACDMSVTDIGKTMNMSRFSIHRRLSAALAKLKKEMEG